MWIKVYYEWIYEISVSVVVDNAKSNICIFNYHKHGVIFVTILSSLSVGISVYASY